MKKSSLVCLKMISLPPALTMREFSCDLHGNLVGLLDESMRVFPSFQQLAHSSQSSSADFIPFLIPGSCLHSSFSPNFDGEVCPVTSSLMALKIFSLQFLKSFFLVWEQERWYWCYIPIETRQTLGAVGGWEWGSKNFFLSKWYSPVSQDACCQAWWSEFMLWDSHDGRREPPPVSCPLTITQTKAHMHTTYYMLTQNKEIKTYLFAAFIQGPSFVGPRLNWDLRATVQWPATHWWLFPHPLVSAS